MKKTKKKSHAVDDSSPFSYLPDEIVLEIVSKIIDLQTLCVCKLVSRRFSCIIHKVNAISFTAPYKTDGVFPSADEQRCTFQSAIKSLRKFTSLMSLCVHHPSSSVDNNRFLFKWKVKFSTRVNSFLYLSPNSICDKKELLLNGNGNDQEREEEYGMKLIEKKLHIAMDCLKYVIVRFKMLHSCTVEFPLLEKVFIMDSGKTGTISLSGSKIDEVRNCSLKIPDRVSWCHVPLLELPVSGYVMKGATLLLVGRDDMPNGNDNFINIDFEDDDFEDKEEAAYNEAVMEIFNKHTGRIEKL